MNSFSASPLHQLTLLELYCIEAKYRAPIEANDLDLESSLEFNPFLELSYDNIGISLVGTELYPVISRDLANEMYRIAGSHMSWFVV